MTAVTDNRSYSDSSDSKKSNTRGTGKIKTVEVDE